MESEFKNPNMKGQSPGFAKLAIEALRKQREQHPYVDMAVGNLPIVGGLQAGMDMTDESQSPVSRGMSALSFIPGGKLLGRLGKEGSAMSGVVDLEEWRQRQKEMANALRDKPDLTGTVPAATTKEVSAAAEKAHINALRQEPAPPLKWEGEGAPSTTAPESVASANLAYIQQLLREEAERAKK